jgi:ribA/ribD-fused uncharacterized protein
MQHCCLKTKKPTVINFYRVSDPYGCFSNFSLHPFDKNGIIWPTSEHYFQAQKFAGTAHEEALRLAPTPKELVKMGRDRSRPLRKDWDQVKDDIMYDALMAKFTAHPELREILLATGDAQLVEHTDKDNYWADGGDGTGKNMLGILLMRLRDHFRKELANNV